METWKKIQKKNKRNEILGIVCMGLVYNFHWQK